MMTRRLLMVLGAAAAVLASPAHAQNYPDRMIRIVVPQGAGGPTDLLARVVAQRLQSTLGQNVVIENRGGAGGVIGAKAVAAAEPDGYTLLLGNSSTLAIIPALSRSAGYDPEKAFAPVAKLVETSQLLLVNPSLPVTNIGELITYAKANPGKLSFASAGVGNILHLAGEMLKVRAGIDMVHVPYNSGAETVTSVLSGNVPMTFVGIAGIAPLIGQGRVRALVTTSPRRLAEFPTVPTMIESGYPDFVVRAFFGLVAPAGTPAAVVAKLNAAIEGGLASPEMQKVFSTVGGEAAPGSPADFAASIASERAKWGAVGKAAGISLE
jgi:tripartite-type tricarboxylate transporter receptor subunit TctC